MQLEADRFIKNAWYVAAWDHEVQPGQRLSRTLLGERVVLFRGQDGRAFALEDRCCHRAAPLSLGRVEGNCIRCMYHGLLFSGEGRCVEIPAQDVIPPQMAVKSYALHEKDHFLWIWMGDPAEAVPASVVDLPWQSGPEWRWKPGYVKYSANIQLIIDNLLDLSHLSFVHLKTLGTSQTAMSKPEYSDIPGGLAINRWDLGSDPTPLHKAAGMSGKVDRWLNFRWFPPAMFLLDSGSCPAGTGAPEGKRTGGIQFRNTSVQTPETVDTTHYFWTHARDFRLEDEALTDQIHAQVEAAFEEDRVIIEAQQAVLKESRGRPLFGIQADAGPARARRLIQEALEAEEDFA
jgi:phenylpropionate dioxygenase-like ring-hydroxylating dioxygenase large terminal subunit